MIEAGLQENPVRLQSVKTNRYLPESPDGCHKYATFHVLLPEMEVECCSHSDSVFIVDGVVVSCEIEVCVSLYCVSYC